MTASVCKSCDLAIMTASVYSISCDLAIMTASVYSISCDLAIMTASDTGGRGGGGK